MGRRHWYNDLARDIRDVRTIQRTYGTPSPQRQRVAGIIVVAFFSALILLIIWFVSVAYMSNKDAKQAKETEAAVSFERILNATAGTPMPTATISPRLLIRYESDGKCLIKGNINSKGKKIYHVPGSPSYESTKIDTTNGERWFCTEYEAQAAGWSAPGN